MPKFRRRFLPALILFGPALQSCTEAQLLWNSSQDILSSSAEPEVCPSRSVNYITDSLPQQCLGVVWTAQLDSGSQATELRTTTSSIPSIPSLIGTPSQVDTKSSSNVDGSTKVTSPDGYKISIDPSLSAAILPKQTGFEVDPDQDSDGESPLDNAKFLSFEEWKKQNLAKAGQSVESVGGRTGVAESEPRRRPGGISNTLDSLGEDAEIEIDFSGFGKSERSSHSILPQESGSSPGNSGTGRNERKTTLKKHVSGTHSRSKDAGRTCKERFNYASFDCAATVLKTNKECTGSTSILVENKDTYMLNKCSADNKFFIVELCDDILVDTVVLANFEFFSSMFRVFRVSVSDRYPVKLDRWRELGTFEAKNSREVQAFLVESPLIWARYLRVELLEHFGNEYYCPVSLLRVHGTTMMEEFNHDMKRLRGEEETELEDGEGEEGIPESDTDVIVADVLKDDIHAEQPGMALLMPLTANSSVLLSPQNNTLDGELAIQSSPSLEISLGFTPYSFLLSTRLEAIIISFLDGRNLTCSLNDGFIENATPKSPLALIYHLTTELKKNNEIPNPSNMESPSQESSPLTRSSTTTVNSKVTDFSSQNGASNNAEEVSNSSKDTTQPSLSSTKAHTSSTQPPAANPTTQESFFKTIHKRLQLLESNSTLSLQYIEEQSRILRDAFSKVEKRQLAKTTNFLEGLNTTVLTELRDFRSQYDQLWQSTVLELSAQRESSRHEVIALSARLSLLADEIIFQKRMAILQFILIILCLGLVLFSRPSSSSLLGANYPELLPLAQSATKSPANLARFARFETPNTSPSSTRPSSRYGLFGRGLEFAKSLSEESRMGSRDTNETKSPDIEHCPPTPTSSGGGAELTDSGKDEVLLDRGLGSDIETDREDGSGGLKS